MLSALPVAPTDAPAPKPASSPEPSKGSKAQGSEFQETYDREDRNAEPAVKETAAKPDQTEKADTGEQTDQAAAAPTDGDKKAEVTVEETSIDLLADAQIVQPAAEADLTDSAIVMPKVDLSSKTPMDSDMANAAVISEKPKTDSPVVGPTPQGKAIQVQQDAPDVQPETQTKGANQTGAESRLAEVDTPLPDDTAFDLTQKTRPTETQSGTVTLPSKQIAAPPMTSEQAVVAPPPTDEISPEDVEPAPDGEAPTQPANTVRVPVDQGQIALVMRALAEGTISKEDFKSLVHADPVAEDADLAVVMQNERAAASSQNTILQTVPRAELGNAVIQQLSALVQRNGAGTYDIALNPPELGSVRISLEAADGTMVVSIQSERPETMDLIRRHVDQLERQLLQLGYDTLDFSFGQSDGDDTDQQSGSSAALDLEADPDTGQQISPIEASPDGAIDIRL